MVSSFSRHGRVFVVVHCDGVPAGAVSVLEVHGLSVFISGHVLVAHQRET